MHEPQLLQWGPSTCHNPWPKEGPPPGLLSHGQSQTPISIIYFKWQMEWGILLLTFSYIINKNSTENIIVLLKFAYSVFVLVRFLSTHKDNRKSGLSSHGYFFYCCYGVYLYSGIHNVWSKWMLSTGLTLSSCCRWFWWVLFWNHSGKYYWLAIFLTQQFQNKLSQFNNFLL